MPLFKTPPTIELRAPVVVAGRPFRMELTIRCRDPLPVDCIDMSLVGDTLYEVVPGLQSDLALQSNNPPATLWRRRWVLMRERVELSPTAHQYAIDAELPSNAPGDYRGPRFRVRWRVEVRVSIPWWPDARRSFNLRVIPPPGAAHVPVAAPSVYASNRRGALGRLPYAEVSLASSVVAPGGTISGYVSLGNCQIHRYISARAAFVQRVRIRGAYLPTPYTDTMGAWRMPLRHAQDNTPIPFAITAPSSIVPGFSHRAVELAWELRVAVTTVTTAEVKVTVPLTVVAAAAHLPPPGATPSLAAVGSERIFNVWSQAAVDAGFQYRAGVLQRDFPRYSLTISLENSAESGNRLVAEARMSEIDIGLHADDDGRLRCRDEAHSHSMAEATDALTRRHRVARADDQHVRFEVADGGTRRRALVELARWFQTLASAVIEARDAMGPPASAVHLEPAWSTVARRMGARFEPAGMDVWGRRGEIPFALETRWSGDGRCITTTLGVGTTIPIDARYRGTFEAGALPDELPEGVRPILAEATALTVVPYGIEIDLRSPAPHTEVDVEALIERLEALIAVARRLSLLDGVYR